MRCAGDSAACRGLAVVSPVDNLAVQRAVQKRNVLCAFIELAEILMFLGSIRNCPIWGKTINARNAYGNLSKIDMLGVVRSIRLIFIYIFYIYLLHYVYAIILVWAR